jgi:hypothetical protein
MNEIFSIEILRNLTLAFALTFLLLFVGYLLQILREKRGCTRCFGKINEFQGSDPCYSNGFKRKHVGDMLRYSMIVEHGGQTYSTSCKFYVKVGKIPEDLSGRIMDIWFNPKKDTVVLVKYRMTDIMRWAILMTACGIITVLIQFFFVN